MLSISKYRSTRISFSSSWTLEKIAFATARFLFKFDSYYILRNTKESVFNCPKCPLPFLPPRVTPRLKVRLWPALMRSGEQMVRSLRDATPHRCHRRPGEELMPLIHIRAKTPSPAQAGTLAPILAGSYIWLRVVLELTPHTVSSSSITPRVTSCC